MEDITTAMTNRNNAKLDCMIYYTLDELGYFFVSSSIVAAMSM
ncbi:hypothetical protein [Holdemanella biformis]